MPSGAARATDGRRFAVIESCSSLRERELARAGRQPPRAVRARTRRGGHSAEETPAARARRDGAGRVASPAPPQVGGRASGSAGSPRLSRSASVVKMSMTSRSSQVRVRTFCGSCSRRLTASRLSTEVLFMAHPPGGRATRLAAIGEKTARCVGWRSRFGRRRGLVVKVADIRLPWLG